MKCCPSYPDCEHNEKASKEIDSYSRFLRSGLPGSGSECSQHKKELFGESDMKVIAEMIGALHYESLQELLLQLSEKLYEDGKKDFRAGRHNLADRLFAAHKSVKLAYESITEAWRISKPFMKS